MLLYYHMGFESSLNLSREKIYRPEDMSFEAQYSRKQNLKINGTNVEAVSIKPETSKTEVPVCVFHGWGASMESFKPGMEVLAKKGRPVLSLDFPRKGGDTINTHNEELEGYYKKIGEPYPKFSSEFLRQAATISSFLEQGKVEKTDIIAHSMAGPSAIIAAMIHPEKFIGRTIVLDNSAGLIGKDSILRLAKGAGANTSRTETMKNIPVTESETEYLESTKHITPEYMAANRLRMAKEILDISNSKIDAHMLRYLKEKGIKVIIVGGVDDTMFPMEGMQGNVKGDSVAGFVSTIGGHMQSQVNSKEFMSAVETMLPKPEQK